MFCPVCSQEQISKDTRFCSRCGFLLVGVSQLIEAGGALPQALVATAPPKISERKKGVKRGAMLMLSSLIIVPILAIITIAAKAEPFLVAIASIITFWGGLLRILYALAFESSNVEAKKGSFLPSFLRRKNLEERKSASSLQVQDNMSELNYLPPAINWRDTNDLNIPPSVIDETTKLLSKNR